MRAEHINDMPEHAKTLRPLHKNRSALLLWFAALTTVATVVAYYTIFMGFQTYDDEGALMTSVKQVLDGYKPYQDISSGYGPIYYLYTCGVRILTHTPVTHDVTRFSSLFPWLATTVLCAWVVLRVTHSIALASVTHFLVLKGLGFFAWEPGHPQELCILLLMIFYTTALFWAPAHRRTPVLIMLGCLTAAMVLIKINLGLFVFIGLGISLLQAAPPHILARFALWCLSTAGLLLPAVLMQSHLNDAPAVVYCMVVTCSMISGLYVLFRRSPEDEVRLRAIWIVFGAFLATIVATVLALIAWGIRLPKILDALVLSHLGPSVIAGTWYNPPRLGGLSAIACVLIVVATILVAVVCAHLPRRRQCAVVSALKLVFGAGALLLQISPAPKLIFGLLPPLSWLLLFPAREEDGNRDWGWRTIFCFVTVLQTLYAYPIAGSQMQFIRIPLIVVAAILLSDALEFARARQFLPLQGSKKATCATAAVLLLVAGAYARSVVVRRSGYEALTSLGLPGAQRIHVPAQDAARYHWLVHNIKTYCDTFMGYPHFPSMNFWSGVRPPGLLNLDDWLYLSAAEQKVIVTDFARSQNACVIYSPKWVAFWNKSKMDLSGMPLVHYIHTEFKTVGENDGFYFMVRNERSLDRLPSVD